MIKRLNIKTFFKSYFIHILYLVIMYRSRKPFNTFYLDVRSDTSIFVKEYGNPNGVPIIVSHGGPGSAYTSDGITNDFISKKLLKLKLKLNNSKYNISILFQRFNIFFITWISKFFIIFYFKFFTCFTTWSHT